MKKRLKTPYVSKYYIRFDYDINQVFYKSKSLWLSA